MFKQLTHRGLSSLLLSLPLRVPDLRRRLRFELTQRYYAEADMGIPIGYGCSAPMLSPEYWSSFEEVFFMAEYAGLGERFALPGRWLDIGCHAGFFSLYMVWHHRKQQTKCDFKALMIDGDDRVEAQINRLVQRNNLGDSIRFQHGAIAVGSGSIRFTERAWMSSGIGANPAIADVGVEREVPIIRPEAIMALLPPPYDLIKIDIEGGEYDFFMGYQDVLRHTNAVLLEWHSWHGGGGGLQQIRQLAAEQGFILHEEFKTPHQIQLPGGDVECGMLLLRRAAV